jgi:hypothetical protein
MIGWEHDKRWSDAYLGHCKEILGRILICAAPIEEDQEHNTDLIVLRMDSVRVGCRIRRESYYYRYPYEFTVRTARPSGAKTELAKILEGWGQFFLYAFAKADNNRLLAWTLVDLNAFRLWYFRQLYAGKRPGEPQTNADGSASFLGFDVRLLPNDIVRERVEAQANAQQTIPLKFAHGDV